MAKLTPEMKARLLRLREEGGLSYNEIARQLGVSSSTVEHHCLWSCAEKPGRPMLSRVVPGMVIHRSDGRVIRRFTDAEDAEILRRAATGERPSRIARAIGRRPGSVITRLYTLARQQARAEMPLGRVSAHD